MRTADKIIAVIDDEVHYLAELYDMKGNFLMKIWEKAAAFDSMDRRKIRSKTSRTFLTLSYGIVPVTLSQRQTLTLCLERS
jgi:hypothetical protein